MSRGRKKVTAHHNFSTQFLQNCKKSHYEWIIGSFLFPFGSIGWSWIWKELSFVLSRYHSSTPLSIRIVSCAFATEGFNPRLTTDLANCSGEISGISDVSTASGGFVFYSFKY